MHHNHDIQRSPYEASKIEWEEMVAGCRSVDRHLRQYKEYRVQVTRCARLRKMSWKMQRLASTQLVSRRSNFLVYPGTKMGLKQDYSDVSSICVSSQMV